MVRVQQVIDSWKTVRQDPAQAVEAIAEKDLDFRPAPDTMTFGEAARHILDAGHALTGMLLEGMDNFAMPDFRNRLKAHTWRTAELAGRPPEFDGQRVTRLEMLPAIKEHELTHQAHLFLCLRLKGMVPSTTRRRMAQQAGL